MDNHVTALDPSHDEAHAARGRVSLPDEPPAFDQSGGPATLHVGEADRLAGSDAAGPLPDAPKTKRRNGRKILLAGVAVIAVCAATAFVFSPYNKIIPVSNALRVRADRLASTAMDPFSNLVAPAARIARASPPADTQPHRDTASVPDPDQELREIIALHPHSHETAPEPGSVTSSTAQMLPSAPAALLLTPHQDLSGASKPSSELEASRPVASLPVAAAPTPPGVITAAPVPPVTLQPPSTTVPSTASVVASVASASPPVIPQPPSGADRSAAAAVAPAASAAPKPFLLEAFETGATPGSTDQDATAPLSKAIFSGAAAAPAPASLVADSPPHALSASVAIVAAPATPPVVAKALPVPSARDPLVVALALRPTAMTVPDQIDVLEAVANLATLVRDIRAENAALKARVIGSTDDVDAKIADFRRRLTLAEAHGALAAAMGGPSEPAATNDTHISGAPVSETIGHPATAVHRPILARPVVQVVVSTSSPSAAEPVQRYRVTAASPGLAMLALVDRSGGEGSQIQISVGDQVPGYGRVSSIQQRGSAWVVQTDKGVIQ